MSLNILAVEDLDEDTLVDHDLIQAPGNKTTNSQHVVVTAQDDVYNKDVTPLTENELEKLPSLDIAFKVVTDNVASVIELKDVENNLIAQESICKQDAEYIQLVCGNLITSNLSLEEFTSLPSKTNLKYVSNFMKNRIAKEELNTVANFQLYIDQPIEDAKMVLNRLTSSYLPSVKDFLYKLNSKAVAFTDAQTNKNTIVKIGDQFVNLLTVDLSSPDICTADIPNVNTDIFCKAAANIKQLLECKTFKCFVHGVKESQSTDYLFSLDGLATYGGASTSINDLIDFYKVTSASSVIDELVTIVEAHIRDMESLQEKSNKFKDDSGSIIQFIIENDKTIMDTHKRICFLVSTVCSLCHLNLNAEPLLDFVNTL
jgi:hypothetical protein